MTGSPQQQSFCPNACGVRTRAPNRFKDLFPAKTTPVYDTYWRFAVERQAMFFRRATQQPPPWTSDSVLQTYKFTNAYRASDRVSQYLIRNVIYQGDQSPQEIFFRTILFKLFNKIETWELLERHFGTIAYTSYHFEKVDKVLTKAMKDKRTIYSAAYIMPSGSKAFRTRKKHRAHLSLLKKMMDDEVPARLADCKSMKQAFELLLSYSMIGDFLAYQYVTDLNYSTLIDFSEMDFVVPGPGALDGIHKCFSSLGGLNEVDIIKLVTERQEQEFERLGLAFQSLWGRPLQLIDCQNLFCEISKYARVMHPDIQGVNNRTRIKQKYRCNNAQIEYWYPPKWGINDLISHSASFHSTIVTAGYRS
ncbi:MAG: nucleotide kinase domain-containing protein [Candidatus Binatia bacterium]